MGIPNQKRFYYPDFREIKSLWMVFETVTSMSRNESGSIPHPREGLSVTVAPKILFRLFLHNSFS